MPEPQPRAIVLDAIKSSRVDLEALLAGLSDDQMTQDGVMEHWSLKDVVAHVTWWEQWMLRVVHGDSEALTELATFRTSEADRFTDEMNAASHAANRQRPLRDVLAEFHASFEQVLEQVASMAEADLADLYRVIAANTFEHYEEHAQGIRTWLDSTTTRRQG